MGTTQSSGVIGNGSGQYFDVFEKERLGSVDSNPSSHKRSNCICQGAFDAQSWDCLQARLGRVRWVAVRRFVLADRGDVHLDRVAVGLLLKHAQGHEILVLAEPDRGSAATVAFADAIDPDGPLHAERRGDSFAGR